MSTRLYVIWWQKSPINFTKPGKREPHAHTRTVRCSGKPFKPAVGLGVVIYDESVWVREALSWSVQRPQGFPDG